jgi:hypothetical protein
MVAAPNLDVQLETMEEAEPRPGNLMKLGVPGYFAGMAANGRSGYWFAVGTGAVERAMKNERLIRAGFPEPAPAYEPIWSVCISSSRFIWIAPSWTAPFRNGGRAF